MQHQVHDMEGERVESCKPVVEPERQVRQRTRARQDNKYIPGADGERLDQVRVVEQEWSRETSRIDRESQYHQPGGIEDFRTTPEGLRGRSGLGGGGGGHCSAARGLGRGFGFHLEFGTGAPRTPYFRRISSQLPCACKITSIPSRTAPWPPAAWVTRCTIARTSGRALDGAAASPARASSGASVRSSPMNATCSSVTPASARIFS